MDSELNSPLQRRQRRNGKLRGLCGTVRNKTEDGTPAEERFLAAKADPSPSPIERNQKVSDMRPV
jgi:hypothetical protein